jgi:general secretion pathway protein N
MKRNWILIAAATLLAMALIMLVTFPAALAWRWWGERAPDLRLQGVTGTVWDGSATRVSVRGQALGRLQWQLSPWQLLRGEPRLHLHLDGPGLTFAGLVRRQGEHEIAVEQLDLEADAGWLAPVLAIPELEPTGLLISHGGSLVLAPTGLLRGIDAHIEWRNAGVRGQVIAQLGSLVIDARGSDGRMDAQIKDGGDSDVEILGSAHIDQGNYRSEITLVPRVAAGPVVEALRWVGVPREQGGRLLVVEGTIDLPGARL